MGQRNMWRAATSPAPRNGARRRPTHLALAPTRCTPCNICISRKTVFPIMVFRSCSATGAGQPPRLLWPALDDRFKTDIEVVTGKVAYKFTTMLASATRRASAAIGSFPPDQPHLWQRQLFRQHRLPLLLCGRTALCRRYRAKTPTTTFNPRFRGLHRFGRSRSSATAPVQATVATWMNATQLTGFFVPSNCITI